MKLHFKIKFEELLIFNQADYQEEDTFNFVINTKIELIEFTDLYRGEYKEVVTNLLEERLFNKDSTLRVYETGNSLEKSSFYLPTDGLYIDIGMKREKLFKFYDELRKESNQIELDSYIEDEIEKVTYESLNKVAYKTYFERYDITIKPKDNASQ